MSDSHHDRLKDRAAYKAWVKATHPEHFTSQVDYSSSPETINNSNSDYKSSPIFKAFEKVIFAGNQHTLILNESINRSTYPLAIGFENGQYSTFTLDGRLHPEGSVVLKKVSIVEQEEELRKEMERIAGVEPFFRNPPTKAEDTLKQFSLADLEAEVSKRKQIRIAELEAELKRLKGE
jgi:hypothetical protein